MPPIKGREKVNNMTKFAEMAITLPQELKGANDANIEVSVLELPKMQEAPFFGGYAESFLDDVGFDSVPEEEFVQLKKSA